MDKLKNQSLNMKILLKNIRKEQKEDWEFPIYKAEVFVDAGYKHVSLGKITNEATDISDFVSSVKDVIVIRLSKGKF